MLGRLLLLLLLVHVGALPAFLLAASVAVEDRGHVDNGAAVTQAVAPGTGAVVCPGGVERAEKQAMC